ncbi:MAG: glycosyl hydrolase [Ginsengibacter sp.]
MKKIYAIIALSCFLQTSFSQIKWPTITEQTKPWTRWWWMGSAVNEKGLDAQLNSLSAVGFGGVEVVPIYGAIGYEQQYVKYLSPRWMQLLDYTVSKASSLKMGVDISVGTGWPIGGPQVTAVDAATKLVVQTYSLAADKTLPRKILIDDVKLRNTPGVFLSALIAYDDKGNSLDITDKVATDGTLNWSPAEGNWQLYAAFVSKTRQLVKRAALGGEGFTLDHFSPVAIKNYFKTFDTAFGNSSHGVRSFFNDSYEVYDADWTPDFFAEFKKRRGYDLRPYIKDLISKEKTDLVSRIKTDYRETMSDLMLENFTQNFTRWAHSKHAGNTNQAHGSPGNLLDLYAAVDQPECETFGSSHFAIKGLRRDSADVRNVDPDPIMLKFASSAAHVTGKPLTSCETFTWLTEHFKTSWSQCKPEVEQVFLSGINHVFYHGTTYSPTDVPFPGWLFYASTNFVLKNSLWPHVKGLNEYITRCQSVLQSGKPDNDFLAYWPVYDAWSNPEGMDLPFRIHDIDKWLYPSSFYKDVVELQRKGFSMDFISDKMIKERLSTGDFQKRKTETIFVPQCNLMPVATLKSIIALAKNGDVVVMQDLPKDVPGLGDLDEQRQELKKAIASISFKKINNDISEFATGNGKIILSNDVQKGLEYAKLKRETLTDIGLKFIRRAVDGDKYYYIVNHTANDIDTTINIQTGSASIIIFDPQNGATGLASGSSTGNTSDVKIQLRSGEAWFLKTSLKKEAAKAWEYLHPTKDVITLNNEWNVHFTSGGPFLPKDEKINSLKPWTDFPDTATQSFSGTAEYTTTFTIKKKTAKDYLLELGKVDESAKVTINGKEVGILWCLPFKANIGKYLKKGENTINIEVANLMANHIRYMDQHKIVWRKYHEINFVNIDYKNFDASGWKVQPSGLEGPVTITSLKN